MKITGGSSRGRVLVSLKGQDIRPTSGRVREAVFNILGNDLTGLTVLDLFAGTGCMGIEALSRGASDAFFIDNSRKSLGLIKKNLIKCGFEKSGVLLNHDILTGLDANKRLGKISIDLVFIDPPYGRDLIPPVLENLARSHMLSSKALVVSESLKSDILPDDIENLHAIDFRIYGETKITFYNLR